MAIEAINVDKTLGNPPNHILHSISLRIEKGEYISLNGKSGSGKSTLLYILSSLDAPTRGEVRLDGVNLADLTTREIHRFRNQKMGFVFQFHHLIPELTALENVMMPALKFKINKQRQAKDWLAEFGLKDKFDRRSTELSGGEQQRVAIARALVMSPEYLFADEPTGNLDSANAATVMGIFEKINRDLGTTVVFVTHDREFAARARRLVHLVDGRMQ